MARTNAISLMASNSAKADLSEIYGKVIENVQKSTLSATLKSQLYTGNPAAGSVELSLPMRGAWIEILNPILRCVEYAFRLILYEMANAFRQNAWAYGRHYRK